MSIVDLIFIMVIIISGLIGFKRGFTKELVCFVGFFLIIVLSFLLKNPLSTLMYEYLPFFKFGGSLKGVTSINILLYEGISFFIIMSILMTIFSFIVFASTVFERLLKMTFILGIPSKILGLVLGLIEGLTWSFIALYILTLPVFNIKELKTSKLKDDILKNTPILSTVTKDTVRASNEFLELKEEYEKDKKMLNTEFDLKSLDIMLKYKIVSIKSVNKLVEKNKLNIKNIDTVINKYVEE